MSNLNALAKEIHKNACEHGWWGDLSDYRTGDGPLVATEGAIAPNRRNFGEVLALIHSEVSEALEEYRAGREPAETHYTWKMVDGFPFDYETDGDQYLLNVNGRLERLERDQFYNLLRIHKVPLKPEGVPSEFADIIIRVLDACAAYGIDIDKAMAEKMAYNETRPYRHGGKRA